MLKSLLVLLFCSCLICCSSQKHSLKVAASATPHAEILAFVKDDLKKDGIDLEIIVVNDYDAPNQGLSEHQIDANYFQHEIFLTSQIAEFGYCLVPIAKIHIEPMGLYSKHIALLNDIPDGSRVAIPNDPTNEARALQLLEKQGLITLNPDNKEKATVLSIQNNPKNLQFIEIDSALLPRTLEEVALAAIPTNYALQAKLSPEDHALAKEDLSSNYVNVLVIRCGSESDPGIVALKNALTSDKVRNYILEHFHGAVLPAF